MPRVRDRRTGRLIAGPTADPAPARWSSPVSSTGGGIPPTGVTPGTYGDATHVGQFTVGADGRLSSAVDVAITFPAVDLSDYLYLPGRTGATNDPLLSTDANGHITGSGLGAGQLRLTGSADPAKPGPVVLFGDITGWPHWPTTAGRSALNIGLGGTWDYGELFPVIDIGEVNNSQTPWVVTRDNSGWIALLFTPSIEIPAAATRTSLQLQGVQFNPDLTLGAGAAADFDEVVGFNDRPALVGAPITTRRGYWYAALSDTGTLSVALDVEADAGFTTAYSVRSTGPATLLAHTGPVIIGDATTISPLAFSDGTGFYTGFQAQPQAGDIAYIFPAADAAGQLTSDGAGGLSWGAVGGTPTRETPTGTINGSNAVFTLSTTPTVHVLFHNGLALTSGAGNDYTLSGTTITYEAGSLPLTGDTHFILIWA